MTLALVFSFDLYSLIAWRLDQELAYHCDGTSANFVSILRT